MFEKFKMSFEEYSKKENAVVKINRESENLRSLILACGGRSYDKGLYSVHTFEDSLEWTSILSSCFENFKEEVISFGHDWMGRQFCLSAKFPDRIFMFDPSEQRDYIIESDLIDFHNNLLSDNKHDFFDDELFYRVMKHLNISSIDYDKCFGFKTPLFLGGKDELDNYDIYNLKMYWDFECQLYHQVKGMPDGTSINTISISQNPRK